MHRMAWLFLALVLALSGTAVALQGRNRPVRILFVGNSLTYVGNLPAVLETVAASQGRPVDADMLVRGGATLTQALREGSVQRALAARHYDVVVLQERGGDVISGPGDPARIDAVASFRVLVQLVRAHGAVPVSLGTYQSMPRPSRWLALAEAQMAAALDVRYVCVAQTFQQGLRAYPDAAWLAPDGMHPGHDLVLAEAMLLYRALFGALPQPQAWVVHAPMYTPRTHRAPPPAFSRSPSSGVEAESYAYPQAKTSQLRALLQATAGR